MLLSYVLIFGKLGLPELGVLGAALAALISRVLEALAMLFMVYLRRPLVAVRIGDFRSLDLNFAGRVFRPMLPVILNETFWSFGITTYFVVYGRMGTESLAAMNIVSTIDNVALVLVFGIANATAIMVGNRIGAGETERAYWFAGRSLLIAMVTGLFIGSQVLLWSPAILSLYKVSEEVIEIASKVLVVVAMFQWIRAYNATMVVGVLRSGGDTRFSFFLDGVIIWIVGVPSAIIGAFVLHLPVYGVYFMVMSEEFLKWVLGLRRFFSRKWIHDMAGRVEIGEEGVVSS
jgi:putative MATE family efflux protein